MSFLKDAFGFLLGGQSKGADWDQIERLMAMSAELNRTNRHGYFSNWDWEEGADGSWTQSQTLKPGLESAADRLLSRANGEGRSAYQSPAQFSSLLDAKMANQMQRHGLLDERTMPNLRQENYGPRAGDRQGGYWSRSDTPSPWSTPPPGGQAQGMLSDREAEMLQSRQPAQRQPSDWDRLYRGSGGGYGDYYKNQRIKP